MTARTRTATVMAFRDQRRRPLVLILLVLVPAVLVIWGAAITKATPDALELPAGAWVTTTRRALDTLDHAKFGVAFVAALVGVFVMQSALNGDRRLIVAGYRAGEAVLARLIVLAAATAVVVVVSALAIATEFTPASWPRVIAALVLTGLIYAAIGALIGALLDKLAATYLILFLAITDFVVQTPMFHPKPAAGAWLLPMYGPSRMLIDGSYSTTFHAGGVLIISVGWTVALAAAVYVVLRRAVGARA